jgi:hypothetical protein
MSNRSSKPKLSITLRNSLVFTAESSKALKTDELGLLHAPREGAAEGRAADLLGDLEAVVPRGRPVDDTATPHLGGADRALTSAASALLLEGLTTTAGHLTPGLHLVGASATVGELVPHHSVEEVLFHFNAKDIVGQLD